MYNKRFKRMLDLIVGILCIPFLFLAVLIVSPLIKLSDGGKIFYVSTRLGQDLKPFKMYKFRTMKEGAPDIRNSDGSTYNSDADDRVTKIGSFLRKTSVDEIPQIINVLLGNMSLIGPRPSPLGNEKSYTQFELEKFNVKPGITGLNQATLRNVATRNQRMENDVFYVNNISFLLDVKILFWTVMNVLVRKNIYNN